METSTSRWSLVGILCLILFALTSSPGAFAVVVSSTADSGAGSLRQAIIDTNAGVGNGTITFSITGTIVVTSKEIVISKDVTITGPGPGLLTVQRSTDAGTPAFRIFNITAGTVIISGMTISNGLVVGATGAAGAPGYMGNSPYTGGNGSNGFNALGGGILNAGTLTLTNCNLNGNSAVGGAGGVGGVGGIAVPGGRGGDGGFGGVGLGGAIYNTQSLTLNNCVLYGNVARGGAGGAGGNGGDGPPVGVNINNSGGNGGVGGLSGKGEGGAFYNTGSLGVTGCVLSGNLAPGGIGGKGGNGGNAGGGSNVGNGGSAGNGGPGYSGFGGVLFDNSTMSNVVFTNCSLSSNGAAGGDGGLGGVFGTGVNNGANGNPGGASYSEGGAVFEEGARSQFTGSAFYGNTAAFGGAIAVNTNGRVETYNCTLAANSAQYGGGCCNTGILSISYSTLSANGASDPSGSAGGGVYSTNSSFYLFDSILAGNNSPTGPDCSGSLYSYDYNLIGTPSGIALAGTTTHTILNQNPRLGPLQNNGGPTLTMALLPGSPAIDAGAVFGSTTIDQRGLPRMVDLPAIPNASGGDTSDIGAFELRPVDRADFNGDGFADLVLQNSAAQQVAFWSTYGANIAGGAYALSGGNPITLPPNWQVVGTGDFNGDGTPDLVLENTSTGQIAFWFTNGVNITGGAYATSGGSPIGVPPGWLIVGVGDFNGDGKPDLVLQNTSSRVVAIWYANGTSITSGVYALSGGNPIPLPPGWQVVGVGDFNGDGAPDLVLNNTSSGQIAFWFTSGNTITSGVYATSNGTPINVPPGWLIAAVGDYNGDGLPDLALQNLSTRQLVFWYVNSTTVTSGVYVYAGANPVLLPTGWQVSGPR